MDGEVKIPIHNGTKENTSEMEGHNKCTITLLEVRVGKVPVAKNDQCSKCPLCPSKIKISLKKTKRKHFKTRGTQKVSH